MWTVIAALVGLFIGWNFPQPAWAKAIQEWVKGWFSTKVPDDTQENK